MVAGLLRAKLANGRKYTESITGQHDDIAGMLVDNARNFSSRNIVDGVCATGVLSYANIVVVWDPGSWVVNDVLKDRTEADGSEDIGFLLGGKVDALGIASPFNIEYASVRPDVLIITNEESARVSR